MRQRKGAEAPLALERAATRGAVFALKSALMDEFWAGKLTMRGADEVQSCTLISMLCDGAPIGVQEGVWVSLTRNLSRHSPPLWGEVAQKGETLYHKTDRLLSTFYWLRSLPWSREGS